MKRPVTKALLCATWALVAGAALAAMPVTQRERMLTVRTAAQAAESRLFELTRLAAPLCPAPVAWRLGPAPLPLADPARDEFARQVHERWLQGRPFGPGERIFVVQQSRTPYALAGIRPGDRIAATEAVGVPASGEAAASAPDLAASMNFQQRRVAESKAMEAQPRRRLRVQRGGETLELTAQAVPVCEQQLLALDSEHLYADVSDKLIVVTVPLLARLDDTELTMALAHEVAQRLLGNQGDSHTSAAALLLMPKAMLQMRDFKRNAELDVDAPSEEALIEADRLTLRLLAAYGLSAADYLGFLERMQAIEALRMKAPVYSRTRGLGDRRKAALLSVVGGAEPPLPAGVDPARWAAFETQALALRTEQALTAPVKTVVAARPSAPVPAPAAAPAPLPTRPSPAASGPAGHRLPVPAPSGFAAGADVEAVPLSPEGRERYRHYLGLQSPKAFVIYAGGGWRFFWNQPEAMTLALDRCAREGKPCWLYAVDDQVVWQPEAGRRIGSSAQLRSASTEANR